MTFKDIPAWYWMIIGALFAIPISYSIFKNGINAKFENKILGKAEIDADPEKTETPEKITKTEEVKG